jgi:hypothetical protein
LRKKTGIKFGLNELDINRNGFLFYADAMNHIIATEFDELIAKNENSDLINEVKRM